MATPESVGTGAPIGVTPEATAALAARGRVREVATLALPVVLQNLSITALHVVDSAMVGRLGQDPRTPKEGITHFSLACNDYYKGEETTQWISVATFNGLSDNAAKILSKGRLVYVEGKVRTRKYDKDGQTRYATGVVAHRWRALDARPKKQESKEYHESVPCEYADDDIPF